MMQYFIVSQPAPTYGLAVLAAVTALGVVTTWLNPGELDSGLGMVLFVQMVLASSGFVVSARRGHFDPMLVHGRARGAALAAQWFASIAPGALAWLVLAACGYLTGAAAAGSALAGARLVALFTVSTMAWVAGFALPRGGGAALWTGVLLVLLLRHVPLIVPGHTQATGLEVVRTALALLVCPFLLLGPQTPIGVPALAVSACAATALLLITWRIGRGIDVFLAERS
jgi:hypothetical protein